MIYDHELRALRRRTIEIDYKHKHRHAGGSLSALPIIAEIYRKREPGDVFILSKGHAAPAFYAVLESLGYKPDTSHPHPERDPANGIECTTGSLGHGLPVAVGIALAKQIKGEPGIVHVLIGDGEALEGTTWEAIHLAQCLGVFDNLVVHLDVNGWQGSCRTIADTILDLKQFACVVVHHTNRGEGVPLFEQHAEWHTHLITDDEFAQIMEDLK